MKSIRALVLALAVMGSFNAHAEETQEDHTLVLTQYGTSALHQTTLEKEVLSNVIEISGMPAWVLFKGMTEVKEVVVPTTFGNERTKTGQNITCTINALQQTSCLIQVSNLSVGQL